MRLRWLKLGVAAGAAALAAAPLMATSASASASDAIAAVVTGNVNNISPQPQNCTPLPTCLVQGSSPFTGEFDQVAITGTFVDGTAPFGGQVSVTPVHISGTQNLVTGSGGLDGSFSAPTFGGSSPTGSLSGTLTSLNFVRVGTLALANVGLTYGVNSTPQTSVSAVAVIAATPNPTNLSSQFADGVVVATGAATPPPV